ncbi:MAG: tRNA uridine-5-carboxymethylaminomethyl(34) synthesis enzyme MnmG [Fusobacteriota bacterium]
MKERYEVIIIGGGHAGVEAALVSARLGKKTALFTLNLDSIAMMSCNPAIGGPGKTHLITEIDVLGGEIGKHIDENNIQLKHLNESKGVASKVTRAQSDKYWYRVNMKSKLEKNKNIDIIQEEIIEIITDKNKVIGVKSGLDINYMSKTVIICTGTFLNGKIVVGKKSYSAGRQGEKAAKQLSQSLMENGIEIDRFQTATPPRVSKKSIDFSKTEEKKGEDFPNFFSVFTDEKRNKNYPTWLTHTNEKTIDVMEKLLKFSPIVTGAIDSKGPRHCPSIDRKVINFPEKKKHQVFLELESLESEEVYVNGITTSLPPFAQEEILKTIPGLENVQVMRYAYGIEYDYAPPYQLKLSLESKKIENLYFAGQINGTSGYEEAAAQGFIAGVNASRKAMDKDPIVIDRSEGYIGVLIDDIINKKLLEPYRVLPSRAEYRLNLRQDNAFLRLLEKSKKIGVIPKSKMERLEKIKEAIETEVKRLLNTKIYPTKENNLVLEGMREPKLKKAISAATLLQRKNIKYRDLKNFIDIREYPKKVIEEVEIEIKYHDFIIREKKQIEKFKKMEKIRIPNNINYNSIDGISNIAKEGLNKIKPSSMGQATRISGITTDDIAILMATIKQNQKQQNQKSNKSG